MDKVIVLNALDNVGVIINEMISKGTKVNVGSEKHIEILEDIKFGFKMAIRSIDKGEKIVKYGEPIGKATQNIREGEMVHIHNVEGLRGRGDL